jgi:ferredoxin-like protein FixX
MKEDQPVHLKVADMNLQKTSEHDVFAGPSNRYCPAGVYEWVEESSGPRFQINAQNCVHCKTCDVKDPERATSPGFRRRAAVASELRGACNHDWCEVGAAAPARSAIVQRFQAGGQIACAMGLRALIRQPFSLRFNAKRGIVAALMRRSGSHLEIDP